MTTPIAQGHELHLLFICTAALDCAESTHPTTTDQPCCSLPETKRKGCAGGRSQQEPLHVNSGSPSLAAAKASGSEVSTQSHLFAIAGAECGLACCRDNSVCMLQTSQHCLEAPATRLSMVQLCLPLLRTMASLYPRVQCKYRQHRNTSGSP